MSSTMLEFQTQDNKIMNVDKRIIHFSELFNTLFENYETDPKKPLAGILENEVNSLVCFCEACNFEIIKFEKPLWKKNFKNYYFGIISKNIKLQEFYEQLNIDNLNYYLKISHFYDSMPLREIIYFKLYDIFNDTQKCINFFSNDDINKIKEIREITDNKKNYLYNKYQSFLEKQIENLNNEEIDKYCNEYYP